MPTAKRLPSGSWNVQIYSHRNSKGRRVYKSFTAGTKRQAELLAAEYKSGKQRIVDDNKTVYEAVTGYINAKEGVLSPSTVRGYERMIKYYKPIEHIKLYQLTSQLFSLIKFNRDLGFALNVESIKIARIGNRLSYNGKKNQNNRKLDK